MITHECDEQGPTFYLIHISYPVLLDNSFAEIGNGVILFSLLHNEQWSVNRILLLLIQTNVLIILVCFPSY